MGEYCRGVTAHVIHSTLGYAIDTVRNFTERGVYVYLHSCKIRPIYIHCQTSQGGASIWRLCVIRAWPDPTFLLASSAAFASRAACHETHRFLSLKLTFLSLQLTFLSLQLTFLSLQLTCLSLARASRVRPCADISARHHFDTADLPLSYRGIHRISQE
jgi:hypothetical protein